MLSEQLLQWSVGANGFAYLRMTLCIRIRAKCNMDQRAWLLSIMDITVMVTLKHTAVVDNLK